MKRMFYLRKHVKTHRESQELPRASSRVLSTINWSSQDQESNEKASKIRKSSTKNAASTTRWISLTFFNSSKRSNFSIFDKPLSKNFFSRFLRNFFYFWRRRSFIRDRRICSTAIRDCSVATSNAVFAFNFSCFSRSKARSNLKKSVQADIAVSHFSAAETQQKHLKEKKENRYSKFFFSQRRQDIMIISSLWSMRVEKNTQLCDCVKDMKKKTDFRDEN